MSNSLLVSMSVAAIVAAILLVRRLWRRDSGGYRRRFVNDAPAPRRDEAFPFASTLYLGDGGASHSHYHHSDCGSSTDAGGGCSDGGGT